MQNFWWRHFHNIVIMDKLFFKSSKYLDFSQTNGEKTKTDIHLNIKIHFTILVVE